MATGRVCSALFGRTSSAESDIYLFVVAGKSVGVCTAVVRLGVFARGSALVRVLL